MPGIFGQEDSVDNLFEERDEVISNSPSVFDVIKDETTPVKKEKEEEEEETEIENETEEVENQEVTENEDEEVTPYGLAIQSLIKKGGEFLVYEGDPEGGRNNYTEDECTHLLLENINTRGAQLAETAIETALSKLNPTFQKMIIGEFQGVQIKDIIADLADYQELEEIPATPTDIQKERIVKAYYRRQAKELGKDGDWVTSKVEKVIERGDLDTEFEDAKSVISKDLENKIKEKEEVVKKQKEDKEKFRRYHTAFIQDTLKDGKIFDMNLSKEEVNLIGNIVTGFTIRKTDGKEKLNMAALMDNLINSDNPKEAYQRLALGALAMAAPEKLIAKLRGTEEKKVTNDIVKKLKVATPGATSIITKKKPATKVGNVFE